MDVKAVIRVPSGALAMRGSNCVLSYTQCVGFVPAGAAPVGSRSGWGWTRASARQASSSMRVAPRIPAVAAGSLVVPLAWNVGQYLERSARARPSARRTSTRMMATAEPYKTALQSQVPMVLEMAMPQVTRLASPVAFDGDALVVALNEADEVEGAAEPTPITLTGAAAEWDEKLDGAITGLIADEKFKAKTGSSISARLFGKGSSIKRISLVGLGKRTTLSKEGSEESKPPVSYKSLFSAAVAAAKGSKAVKKVGLILPDGVEWSAQMCTDAGEAFCAYAFKDERFQGSIAAEAKEKEGTTDEPLASFCLLGSSGSDVAQDSDFDASVARAKAIARGQGFAKHLVNAPPNVVNPVSLAESAKYIASQHADVMSIKILERDECEALGMGSYLAVGRGSVYPPKFIHMTYKPASGTATKKLAFVGKGLTFDSGGYNIKTQMMEKMKFDMGGSAAVLGAAAAIAGIKPANVEVHFIVAACENMVDSDAYRPGDIITASNGVTIEVLNTDAEGRLTLADALVYAEKLGSVDAILEMSTLTGAIMMALGNDYAGLFTQNDAFAERIQKSAKAGGEKMWRMPMPDEYAEQIKSKIADLQNIGSAPRGGAITAALFLQKFVKKVPFAHLDIANTAWDWTASQASGYGVKTYLNLAELYAKEDKE